jgi:hypothetical protein
VALRLQVERRPAKIVNHGRDVAFQMAEVAISRNLLAEILRLIAELRPPMLRRQRESLVCTTFAQTHRRGAPYDGKLCAS